MTRKILICIFALFISSGMSLSIGPGTANADIFTSIYRVADDVASVLVRKFGFPFTQSRNGFIAQATKFNPVTTEAELNNIRLQWTNFERRAVSPGEVVPRKGGIPPGQKFVYEQASQLWCETTVSLIAYPDKSFWDVTIDQVKGQVVEMLPLIGPPLAIHIQIVEINEKLQQNCICEAQAMIQVMSIQQTFC